MNIDAAAVRKCLKSFDFPTLFREHLGWDKHQGQLSIPIDGQTIQLNAVAQKRGFAAYVCSSIPDRATRLKIDQQVTKTAREHFIVYADQSAGQQVWQWVRREPGKPLASRDHRFDASQSGDPLIQRLANIAVSFEEEEEFTLTSAVGRVRKAFDVDKVTKKFYERFQAEHAAFQKFIKGIKSDADLQWYTSIMLNRLMFVYFIQKKGFLDGDTEYLRNRMKQVRESKGKDKFLTFYRYFLLRLFHDALGKSPEERKLDRELEKLLGKVPYLNGGFFEGHELEARNPDIDIPDNAFEKLFDFFDDFRWHLDERPLRADNEINPDVVGYIFEKYINQKQMGAYYTKEDITEYISKNTIIPFLFDAAEKKCSIAFKPDSFLWKLLRDNPDRYIYAAVRHGVIDDHGQVIPLPKEIEAGVKNAAKRDGWNRAAVEPFALPTETWREHVARRERCLELREKLQRGQVHAINDLVTLNLDIWQFARDAIVSSEGPELLRAFWQAIQKVTVLDPTCGSGAFLFAALRILESLYSDCLERMERFVEDLAGKNHHPEQFNDFKKVLTQIAKHPNDRYFIYKSIIIGNLFGVDIMEEAVEICKLRLFLKLVAQVETVDQIEPLPDIDFNIRAGNTLVGYVSLDQVRKAREREGAGVKKQKLMLDSDAEAEIQRIEEDALAVEKAFEQFRAQQTTHGGHVTSKDKQELRRRLKKLDSELDRYLAGEYGVDVERKKNDVFDQWRTSHQPFHWFVEFYGIMVRGGFDVVIGNPPYVEYGKVRNTYTVLRYKTESCANLYAFTWERCIAIGNSAARIGMIVPVASVCTDGYASLQSLLHETGTSVVSNFNDRPSKLFDGLEHIRLCIILHELGVAQRRAFSTTYNKWQSAERANLFSLLAYVETTGLNLGAAIAKIGTPIEASLLRIVDRDTRRLTDFISDRGKHLIYYTRKLSHFVQILNFIPSIRDGKGRERQPSELKELKFEKASERDVFLAILNSTTFYWLLTVYSDCRNLNKREVESVRFDIASAQPAVTDGLVAKARALMKDVRRNSQVLTLNYKAHGTMHIQCTYPRFSKPIIDEIDTLIGHHFGFSDDDLDFIVNFDIKYRLGQDETEDDE